MKDRELRAPKKKYFKMEYPTVMNVLDNLTDSELGEYFKAVAEYELYGIVPESFSDRAVQMAFQITARELDYQLEKHFNNIERGKENKGSTKKNEEGSLTLSEVLTREDLKYLESEYPCHEILIEEVQKQIDANHTEVKHPRRYIEKYARETGWKQRLEASINNVAHGLTDAM